MILKEENKLNILFIQYLSAITVLPLNINLNTAQIHIYSHGRKRYLLIFFILINQLHILASSLRFLLAVSESMEDTIPLVSLYYLITCIPQIGTLMGLKHFLINPGVVQTIFNGSMDLYPARQLIKKARVVRRKRPRTFWSFSFIEIITIVLPVLMFPAGLVTLVAMIYMDGLWPKSWSLMALCQSLFIIFDALVILGWMSFAYFSFHLQLLFMSKVAAVFEEEFAKSRY